MEYKGTMLVVKDMEKTKQFYTSLLGMSIVSDLGVNVGFSGGFAAQAEDSWIQFTGSEPGQFQYGGHDVELYFEEVDFDGFVAKAKAADVEIVSETVMPYGQKVLRIYDPDKHIVEVGEDMGVMVRRMSGEGLTDEQIAEKTFLPPEAICTFFKGVTDFGCSAIMRDTAITRSAQSDASPAVDLLPVSPVSAGMVHCGLLLDGDNEQAATV